MSKKTPLDDLIISLTNMGFDKKIQPKSLINLVRHHLQLLRVIYLNMIVEDFYTLQTSKVAGPSRSLTPEEYSLDSPYHSYKSTLDYMEFISILNQLGRVLKTRSFINNLSEFPMYFRVRFYRNCIVEHWEEYIETIGGVGFTFTKGKASIPTIQSVWVNDDKERIRNQLVREFKKLNLNFKLSEDEYQWFPTNEIYSNAVFRNLENINTRLVTKKSRKGIINYIKRIFRRNHKTNPEIPKEIVSLLIKLGFPSPICDIEEYLNQLSLFLINILNVKLVRTK